MGLGVVSYRMGLCMYLRTVHTYVRRMYVCLFGSNHIMKITMVNLQNQLTNVSGKI